MQNPITFIVWGLIIAGFAYGAARLQFSNEISALKERISLRDDRIADYERKLEGASPDEAASRIAVLEGRIAELEPRALTSDQLKILGKELRNEMHEIRIVHNLGSIKSSLIYNQLLSAFDKADWDVTYNTTLDEGENPPSGIAIISSEASNNAKEIVLRAFDAAKLDYDTLDSDHPNSPLMLLLIDPIVPKP